MKLKVSPSVFLISAALADQADLGQRRALPPDNALQLYQAQSDDPTFKRADVHSYLLQKMVDGADVSVHTFDKTDSPFIRKIYNVDVEDGCSSSDLDTYCGITATSRKTMTNDASLLKCLDNLLPDCKITITGSWNWTRPDAPNVCVTSYLGFKLPIVAGVLPFDACEYGPVTWFDLPLGQDVRAEEINGFVTKQNCSFFYTDQMPEACVPRIEWGNDLPQWGCKPPNILKASAVTPSTVSVMPTQILWDMPDWFRPSPRGDHINLRVDLGALRTDRKAAGFIMSLGGTDPLLTAGNFYGMEVPIKCTTTGRKGTLTPGDDDEQANFYQKARRYKL